MIATILLFGFGFLSLAGVVLWQQRKILDMDKKGFGFATKKELQHFLDELTRFKKGQDFLGKRERFTRQRIEDVMKRMDRMDGDFVEFGSFISKAVADMDAVANNKKTPTRTASNEIACPK